MKRYLIILAVILALALAATLAYALLPGAALAEDQVADHVRVEKAARRLTLFRDGAELKSYYVALGRQPVGAKEREGDCRTPEGRYQIDYHKPDSAFHLALHISYPNADDRRRAKDLGVSPGDAIMIHGLRNGIGWLGRLQRVADWTKGCIAVTDAEIEEIYRTVPDGTTIEILP